MRENIKIYYESSVSLKKATELSARLNVPVSDEKAEDGSLYLVINENGVSLESDGMSVKGDFSKMARRVTAQNIKTEFLVKAAKPKECGENPTAVDATAGLGEDSFILAAAGFDVTLFEYDPVIAVLLEDAVERAKNDSLLSGTAGRMHVICGDSIEGMKKLGFVPDIVLLDPMFPERTKSASVKKKFQLLHHLENPCGEEEELLEAALYTKAHRILIKRPAKGPFLAGRKPDYSIPGKAVRYDCIITHPETKQKETI